MRVLPLSWNPWKYISPPASLQAIKGPRIVRFGFDPNVCETDFLQRCISATMLES